MQTRDLAFEQTSEATALREEIGAKEKKGYRLDFPCRRGLHCKFRVFDFQLNP